MLEPFDLYTPGLRQLHQFEFDGEEALLDAEVRRTLDALAAAAPARIAKGQVSPSEAELQALLWRAIDADLERGPDNLTEQPACARGCLRELKVAANGVRWEAKVAELRREIELRRRTYPGLVDKGQLTSGTARQQLERLEAIHDLYWRHGFAFDGTLAERRALSDVVINHNLSLEKAA